MAPFWRLVATIYCLRCTAVSGRTAGVCDSLHRGGRPCWTPRGVDVPTDAHVAVGLPNDLEESGGNEAAGLPVNQAGGPRTETRYPAEDLGLAWR